MDDTSSTRSTHLKFHKLQKISFWCQVFVRKLSKHKFYPPPNDAATATEPATDPAALATAANPLAPITGRIVPNVGAKALTPAAIAGAARPVEESSLTPNLRKLIRTCSSRRITPGNCQYGSPG